jgi:hypothetical protein
MSASRRAFLFGFGATLGAVALAKYEPLLPVQSVTLLSDDLPFDLRLYDGILIQGHAGGLLTAGQVYIRRANGPVILHGAVAPGGFYRWQAMSPLDLLVSLPDQPLVVEFDGGPVDFEWTFENRHQDTSVRYSELFQYPHDAPSELSNMNLAA